MQKIIIFSLFIFSIFTSYSSAGNVNIVDTAGRYVNVPSNPQRIICLGPGALRLIIYMGCADKVVGLENYETKNSKWHSYWKTQLKLEKLPIIGPGGHKSKDTLPNLDKITNLKPDLIIASFIQPKIANKISYKTGIPVLMVSYGVLGTIDITMYNSLVQLGKVFNKQKRAQSIIDFINDQRTELAKQAKMSKYYDKSTVYAGGIKVNDSIKISNSTPEFIPFKWLNTENVIIKKTKENYNAKEELQTCNPDYIFIINGKSKTIKNDFAKNKKDYLSLNAFKNGNVYNIYPFKRYVTNIGTALLDAYCIGKILYPDTFADVELNKIADEIYKFLLDKPIYKDIKEHYGVIGEKIIF